MNLLCFGAIFQCCKWPNIEKYYNHLVTLIYTQKVDVMKGKILYETVFLFLMWKMCILLWKNENIGSQMGQARKKIFVGTKDRK